MDQFLRRMVMRRFGVWGMPRLGGRSIRIVELNKLSLEDVVFSGGGVNSRFLVVEVAAPDPEGGTFITVSHFGHSTNRLTMSGGASSHWWQWGHSKTTSLLMPLL